MNVLKLLALLAVGALLFKGGEMMMQSRSLQLETFEVEGNTEGRVSSSQIIRATGVHPGQQLVGISTGEVARRLEKLPWVRQARVERILPSTLRIAVEERTPSLVIQTSQGPYLVDGSGLVLQQGSEKLVSLEDVPVDQLAPGARISTPEFVHAARILGSLPQQIRSTVASVRAPTIDQIQIETAGGTVIYYGAAEQIDEKNFAAQTLLDRNSAGSASAGIIDVRVPSRPATRPR